MSLRTRLDRLEKAKGGQGVSPYLRVTLVDDGRRSYAEHNGTRIEQPMGESDEAFLARIQEAIGPDFLLIRRQIV